jgi:hypothetical protein
MKPVAAAGTVLRDVICDRNTYQDVCLPAGSLREKYFAGDNLQPF